MKLEQQYGTLWNNGTYKMRCFNNSLTANRRTAKHNLNIIFERLTAGCLKFQI